MDGRTISTEIPDSAAPAKDIRTRVRTHPPMVLSAMEREIKVDGTVGLFLGGGRDILILRTAVRDNGK